MPDVEGSRSTSAAVLASLWASVAHLTWRNVAFGAAIFTGTLVVNLILLGVILLKLPPTYLAEDYLHRRGVLRAIAVNLVGLGLVALGIVTSLPGVPGQGLLTIVIGILLMDVPGKRRLARRVLGRHGLLDRINRFRHRFGMAPLVLGSP